MRADRMPVVRRRSSSRPRRRGVAAFALLALLVLVAVVGYLAWSQVLRPQAPTVEAGQPVQVVIPEGAGTRDIALLLQSKGVIDSAGTFRLRARFGELDGQLKAGTYDLKTGMEDDRVLELLADGPVIEYVTVTIPEGLTIPQIAERLEKKAGIPRDDFAELAANGASRYAAKYSFLKGIKTGSLEGYLFPKTYTFQKDVTAEDAVEIMLQQFESEVAELDLSYARQKNLDLNDIVIIASLVEREAKIAKDRPLVSSVVYNRLKRKMKLQMCATVQFLLGKPRARLLYRDLQIQSPYNTYLHEGLPPGPIAAPGLDALKAAASPARTDYLYYVLTGKDGSHTFASNSDDFLAAKAQAKRGLK